MVRVNGIDGEEGASELIMTAEIQSADELDMLIFRPRSQEALPENGWQYLDPDGNVQGPFSLEMMRDWSTKGYLQQHLPMRFDPNDDFIQLRELFPVGTVPFVTSIAQRSQAKETPEAGEVASDETENGAKYCKDCAMWLNGPQQYEDHVIGKKHKNNLKKAKTNAEVAPKKPPQEEPPAQVTQASAEEKPETPNHSDDTEVASTGHGFPASHSGTYLQYLQMYPHPQMHPQMYPQTRMYPQMYMDPWGQPQAGYRI